MRSPENRPSQEPLRESDLRLDKIRGFLTGLAPENVDARAFIDLMLQNEKYSLYLRDKKAGKYTSIPAKSFVSQQEYIAKECITSESYKKAHETSSDLINEYISAYYAERKKYPEDTPEGEEEYLDLRQEALMNIKKLQKEIL